MISKKRVLKNNFRGRKKIRLQEDEIKKIMTQYDFVPEYIPNFQNLLKGDSSIHNLKLQKSKSL